MLDTNSSGSRPRGHDAETFRVAEELIMLSNHATASPPTPSPLEQNPTLGTDSPSNISGFFEHTANESALSKVKMQARAHQRNRRASTLTTTQDIINSRCDVSHSELLKEHRVRFRRTRRRWNLEQRTKNREYLARFHVQGIPLVQHLEALTHWR
ncbi:hypothetical protein PHYBOEH_011036 [Phytophthora boehmeriae]|uniref:Uncharacterized protein n=1 Tax=Phytophthora boehmeriae TaxID=109152 RepID=A0A8T1X6K2_9STRA|nr:hypothetical protein PHYBOEH_011036 [Phytophthora boehmeriae]